MYYLKLLETLWYCEQMKKDLFCSLTMQLIVFQENFINR